MSLQVDLYWSFRSPYSYLITGRLCELSKAYDVEINVKPVYPIAVRKKGFFVSQDPLWVPYLFRDTMRLADFLGIPFSWPRPDPVVVERSTGDAADEQPYIHRLTRLGVLAAEQGRGLPFLDEVGRIIWSGEIDGWDQGDHLKNAVVRAGCDLAAMDEALIQEGERLEAQIVQNQDNQREAGHWGVPLMVFQGEPYFGQDRFDVLVWQLEQSGLKPRV